METPQTFYTKFGLLCSRNDNVKSVPSIEPGKMSKLISPRFFAPSGVGLKEMKNYDMTKYDLGPVTLKATAVRRDVFNGHFGLDITDNSKKKKGTGLLRGTVLLTSQLAPLVPVLKRLLNRKVKDSSPEILIILKQYGRTLIERPNKNGQRTIRVLVTVTDMEVMNYGPVIKYNPIKRVTNKDLGMVPFDIYSHFSPGGPGWAVDYHSFLNIKN